MRSIAIHKDQQTVASGSPDGTGISPPPFNGEPPLFVLLFVFVLRRGEHLEPLFQYPVGVRVVSLCDVRNLLRQRSRVVQVAQMLHQECELDCLHFIVSDV